MARILLDLNAASFQQDWFAMQWEDIQAVFETLRKIRSLDWNQLYSDRGLRWELIASRTGPQNRRLYSLRITGKCRAVAYREEDVLRMVSLHPDHDSTYKK
jgi:hypothetical protein